MSTYRVRHSRLEGPDDCKPCLDTAGHTPDVNEHNEYALPQAFVEAGRGRVKCLLQFLKCFRGQILRADLLYKLRLWGYMLHQMLSLKHVTCIMKICFWLQLWQGTRDMSIHAGCQTQPRPGCAGNPAPVRWRCCPRLSSLRIVHC